MHEGNIREYPTCKDGPCQCWSDWTLHPVLQILLQTGDPGACGRAQACVQVWEECTRLERTGDVNFTDTYLIYFLQLAYIGLLFFYHGFTEILSTYGLNIECIHSAWTSFPQSTCMHCFIFGHRTTASLSNQYHFQEIYITRWTICQWFFLSIHQKPKTSQAGIWMCIY